VQVQPWSGSCHAHHHGGGQRLSYWINEAIQKGVIAKAAKVNSSHRSPGSSGSRRWASLVLTFVVSNLLIKRLAGDGTCGGKLSCIINCGTLAGPSSPS